MTDLKTTFAGLSLRNPIIISSSGLTNSAGKNKKLAEDGAGAIVLKSLFEEQIMLEADQLKDPAFYPERKQEGMPHSYHCQHQLLH